MGVDRGGGIVVGMPEDSLEDLRLDAGTDGEGGIGVAAIIGGHAFDAQGGHQFFPLALGEIGICMVSGGHKPAGNRVASSNLASSSKPLKLLEFQGLFLFLPKSHDLILHIKI